MSYFSEKIKALRLQNEYTQKEVASEIGISQGNYSSLESGKNDPSLTTLQALSEFYNEFIDTLVCPIVIMDDRDITEKERVILRKYNRLNMRDKIEVEGIMDLKLRKYSKDNEDDD